MSASDTIWSLAHRLQISYGQAEAILQAVGDWVVDRLGQGEVAYLPGVGLFYMEWRERRGGGCEWVTRLKLADQSVHAITQALDRHARSAQQVFDVEHRDEWAPPRFDGKSEAPE